MEQSDGPRFTFALKRGAIVAARYRIDRLLADSSSFALTYLATDTSSTDQPQPTVAIKEFLPRVLVGRARDGCTVQPHSPANEREFGRALQRFVREGEVLRDIESPHLVRVQQCLEENGTAYLLMTPRQGKVLPAVLADAAGGCMTGEDAISMALRLLEPLERIHAGGVLHRAISPEAIVLTEEWEPVLYGFSARRHVSTEAPEIVPGYAAFEQYGSGEVGPWTDVYSSAALLYYLVTGVAPPSAIERATGKPLAPAGWLGRDVSPALSAAIAHGLALMPDQRPQDAAAFRKELEAAADSANPGSPVLEPASTVEASSAGAESSSDRDGMAASELGVSEGKEGNRRLARRLREMADRVRSRVRPPSPMPSIRKMSAIVQAGKAWRARARVQDAGQLQEPEEATAGQRADQAEELSTYDSIELERDATRQSLIRFGTAAVLTLVVIGSTNWMLARRRDADLRRSELGAAEVQTAAGEARPVGPATRSGDSGGPLQQGVLFGVESAKTRSSSGPSDTQRTTSGETTSRSTMPSLPTIKAVNVAAPTDAEKKFVPVDVVLDLRTQLANGKEQVEQGQYALARRIFASALTAANAAINKFSGAENLRSIRTEIDSADRGALRACQAENEVTRKRGGTVVPCE